MQESPSLNDPVSEHHDSFDIPNPEVRAHYLQMSDDELIDYLYDNYPEISEQIWKQLQILNQPAIELQLREQAMGAIETSANIARTHLGYELEMVRVVLAYQEIIDQFIFTDDDSPISFGSFEMHRGDLTHRLVFMIMLSDVGKAGSRPLAAEESSSILQIYTHVIMDASRHSPWLKSRNADNFPPDLSTAVEFIVSQPDLYQQVFGAGNFGLAPVRLALYCAEQVFMQTFPDAEEHRHCYQR